MPERLGRKGGQMTLVDRALADKPAEVKSRVLDLILRMGIDPEDEFFLIFIALGQLQVLIEDTPRDWQALFESFEQELQSWERKNIAALAELAQQVDTMRQLATSSRKLNNTLSVLSMSFAQMLPVLEASTKDSHSTMHQLQEICDQQNRNLNYIRAEMRSYRQLREEQSESGESKIQIPEWISEPVMAQTCRFIFGSPFWGGFIGAFAAICFMHVVWRRL